MTFQREEMIPKLSVDCFNDLLRSYREPQRFYHTLAHIADLFLKLTLLDAGPLESSALAYAVWYHDSVYDPMRTDNEERSAERAVHELTACQLGPRKIETVRRLILLTKHGSGLPECELDARFLDADLAILGATNETYELYSQAIRQEYAHVKESEYRTGRAAVLRGFLNRPAIFHSTFAYQNWENSARRNLEHEIASLSK